MPDLGELALLAVVGVAAALFIVATLRERTAAPSATHDDLDTRQLRYRVALESIRDVETDRRAGSLDDAAYAVQRAEAEGRAVAALAELEAAAQAGSTADGQPTAAGAVVPRHWIAGIGALLALLLLGGLFAPPPLSLANPTRRNEALAGSIAAEEARHATITRLLDRLAANPRDVASLSELADAYLQGGTSTDLASGARVLLAVIAIEPKNASAYERLITAYINAGDWTDAAAATDAYAKVAPGSPDIPFFRGLIALRGTGDRATAASQLRRFLTLAPDDPRAVMVRALLSEVTASPSP